MALDITWMRGEIKLDKPFVFDNKDKTVVVLGNVSSDFEMTFKVNNLVVFGVIKCEKDLSIEATNGCYIAGSLTIAGDMKVKADCYHNGVSDRALEKIRALGIDLKRLPTGGFSVRPY
ncbi:MAG: hypothetical protein V4492_06930 [Chlamydiota bacterium]